MSTEHYPRADAYVDHGDASMLFPVDSLGATVYQYRDAEIRLETVSGGVVAVAPTGLASSYFLAQHPLSVIPIESLSREVKTAVAERTGLQLTEYEYIQIGRKTGPTTNHSLGEY